MARKIVIILTVIRIIAGHKTARVLPPLPTRKAMMIEIITE
jgi:hypothetical protein